jgi:hypothetical protein
VKSQKSRKKKTFVKGDKSEDFLRKKHEKRAIFLADFFKVKRADLAINPLTY